MKRLREVRPETSAEGSETATGALGYPGGIGTGHGGTTRPRENGDETGSERPIAPNDTATSTG